MNTGKVEDLLEGPEDASPPTQRVDPNGKWIDHPQIHWPDALAATRKLCAETAVRVTVEARGLKDFEDGILWAGEMAEEPRANWKKAARHVIDCLPRVES